MKILKLLFVLFILIASVVPAQCDLFKSKAVNKANDFIAAGMIKEAIQTLQYGIKEEPTDHEAHWMLGKMYLEGGYYSGAEERFNSAILLKPDLKDQLGSLYKNTASSELAKGKIDQAISLFKSAANYDAGLRKSIGQECFSTGKKYLSLGQSGYADKLFSLAKSMDGSLSTNIQEAQASYGKQMLEIAKSKPKNARKKYSNEAKKYLSKSRINEIWGATTEVIFEGVFTDKDINPETGNIDVMFGKNAIRGDLFEVSATLPNSAEEIYIFLGKNNNPKWKLSKDGYGTLKVEVSTPGQTIWIDKEKGIKARVRVLRDNTP